MLSIRKSKLKLAKLSMNCITFPKLGVVDLTFCHAMSNGVIEYLEESYELQL